MNEDTIIARACRLSVALGLLCSQSLVAGEMKLDFGGDFDWTVGESRSEVSVKREIPACVGFTEGKDVDFTSKEKPFTVIAVTRGMLIITEQIGTEFDQNRVVYFDLPLRQAADASDAP